MTIEELIELQEAGAKARTLGLPRHTNPYLDSYKAQKEDADALGDWLARLDAWKFGWEAENASREGNLASYVSDLLSPLARASATA